MKNESARYEYEVQKSKFIGLIFDVSSHNEVLEILSELKKEHKKARHICYAYHIINNNSYQIKSSDDGEPKGTASGPLINIIQNNNHKNIAIFIIRYFGGTKLGVGGLYRAYSKTASEAFKQLNNFSAMKLR